MAAVTAAMVKELREMTGAGMMDCKKALAATDGDMDKAVDFLREKGLAGAAKKAKSFSSFLVIKRSTSLYSLQAIVSYSVGSILPYQNSSKILIQHPPRRSAPEG